MKISMAMEPFGDEMNVDVSINYGLENGNPFVLTNFPIGMNVLFAVTN
jgi:hypothetical protein